MGIVSEVHGEKVCRVEWGSECRRGRIFVEDDV